MTYRDRPDQKREQHGFQAKRFAVTMGPKIDRKLNEKGDLREQAAAHPDMMSHVSLSCAANDPSRSIWGRALLRLAVAVEDLGATQSDLEIAPLACRQVIAMGTQDGPRATVEELLNGHAAEDAGVQLTLTEALADECFTPEEKLRVAEALEGEIASALSTVRRLRQEATAAGVG